MSKSLTIVYDDRLAMDHIQLNPMHRWLPVPGRQITADQLANVHADALIVRTITPITAALLQPTSLQFVATASAGFDHLDIPALTDAKITWAYAPGCNADAVRDYVLCTLAALIQQKRLPLFPKLIPFISCKSPTHQTENRTKPHPPPGTGRAGVIGVGQVGRRVVALLTAMGYTVLQHDPWRALSRLTSATTTSPADKANGKIHSDTNINTNVNVNTGSDSDSNANVNVNADANMEAFDSQPLSAFKDLDLISIHTPLTRSEPYPTYHLLNKDLLAKQRPGTIIINAARGENLDPSALLQLNDRLTFCCDVWSHEPAIDAACVEAAYLATPHIAGYSRLAKARATTMVLTQASEFFQTPLFDELTPDNNNENNNISSRRHHYTYARTHTHTHSYTHRHKSHRHHTEVTSRSFKQSAPFSMTLEAFFQQPHWIEQTLSYYDPWKHTQTFKAGLAAQIPISSQQATQPPISSQQMADYFIAQRRAYPLREEFEFLTIPDRQMT